MAKFNKNDYNFIDLSETDHTEMTAVELDKCIADTMEVLKMTKRKISSSIMNLSLVSGLLGVRGGEFVKINVFSAKYNKGNCTKEELKVIKSVINTAKWYYRLKVIIILIAQKQGEMDEVTPLLANKK